MHSIRIVSSLAAIVTAGLFSGGATAARIVYSEPTEGGHTRFVIICDDGFITGFTGTGPEAAAEAAPLICAARGSSRVDPSVPPTPVDAPDVRSNFSGIHVEWVAGVDSSNAGGQASSGVLYGLAAGYDLRSGGAVFGLEAEVADATTRDCDADFCAKAGRDFYVGGRAGAVVSENVLLYAKAGYANARVTAFDNGSSFNSGFSFSADLDGVRAGVGLEWQAGRRFLVRTEYRYSNYESDFSRHQGIVGLGIRF